MDSKDLRNEIFNKCFDLYDKFEQDVMSYLNDYIKEKYSDFTYYEMIQILRETFKDLPKEIDWNVYSDMGRHKKHFKKNPNEPDKQDLKKQLDLERTNLFKQIEDIDKKLKDL